MNSNRSRAVFLVLWMGSALTFSAPTRGFGDEPARAGFDPEAGRLLNEVIGAYRALPAYGDQGELVLDMVVDGRLKSQKIPLRLNLVRPNKLSLETGLARVVSDGATMTTVASSLKKYTSVPAPKVVTFDTVFTGGPVGSAVFGGPSSPMMHVVLNLLLGDDPAKALLDLGDKLTQAEDRVIDGKPARVLRLASEGGGLAFFLSIDPETKLLRAIDLAFDPKALADAFPEGRSVKIETFRWSAGHVTTTPPDDSTFAFEPPKGYSKFDAPSSAPAGEAEQKFLVESLVGKLAPDFNLTVLDGEGKTRTVSRSDLAGKVVMIDFWATYCGPCLLALPETQKLIEGYARDKRDVVIVALSQDDDPRDPAEVRKLIETTLEKEKVVLTGTPVGLVGIDPSNSVGEAFKVEGYPTVVILDRKGVVRFANVGGESAKVLSEQIDSLLGDKAKAGTKD